MSKLLRSEKEIQLGELLRSCRKSADHYRLAVDLVEPPDSGTLKRFADQRTGLCNSIDGLMRSCGYRPVAPDADRQTVIRITERAKTLLSRDEWKTLLDDAARLESDLQTAFQTVLGHSWEEDRWRQLRRMQSEFLETKKELEALHDTYSDHGS